MSHKIAAQTAETRGSGRKLKAHVVDLDYSEW